MTELRRLQRIRSEFIDNLSHELRTPLTTIRLLTETLAQDLPTEADVPPRMRERIHKIDVETGHLAQMVNELLDLSRIEGGAAELHFDDVDMPRGRQLPRSTGCAPLPSASASACRDRAARRRELPRVRGDDERLGQVLVNLLHNAVKFSSAGSTVDGLGAAVATARSPSRFAIRASASPTADLDRIFERFYKVDKSRTPGRGGTGLGLSIARHIVEGHGGRIWAESEEGKGSAFTFTVPLA